MLKFVILGFSIIILLLFFVLYEGIFLEFYEENKAEHYSDLIWITIFSVFYLFIFFMGFITSIKRKENDWKNFTKEAAGFAIVLVLSYIVFIRPVFSGLLMFLNVSVGYQDLVYIEGKVFAKTGVPKQKGSEFTIVVEDVLVGEITLSTNAITSEYYKIGDSFQKELSKGIFGIIYLKK